MALRGREWSRAPRLRGRCGRLGAGLARLTVAACALVAPASAQQEEAAEVVVVVAAQNPLTTLTRAELADLFLGRASRFPDGRPAVPIDQREGSAARVEFYSAFLGRSLAQIKAHWSKVVFTGRGSPPRAVADDEQLRRIVAADPTAIGYVERGAAVPGLRVVRIL